MMSTGSESSGVVSYNLVENEISPQQITRACKATDAARVRSIFTSAPLLDLGDKGNALEPGSRQAAHHLLDRAVIALGVAAHEDALRGTAARIGDGFQLRYQFVGGDFGVVEEYLAGELHRQRQRLLVLIEALGRRLRQVQRHADGEKRRG